MAKIVDPDLLVRDTNIVFSTASNASGSKTIQLVRDVALSYEGVTGQAVYSKCKELWKDESDLIRVPFPIISITEKKFDFVNRWDWSDYETRTLVRDAGWAVKDTANNSLEEWLGFVTLGTLADDDQVYYQQSASISSSNNVFTGSVNNAVRIYKSASYGDVFGGITEFDYRDYFKCFVRTYERTYDQSQLSDIGETVVTYQVYAFPLTNATDPKITTVDAIVSSSAPYTGITVYYYTASLPRTVGMGVYQFDTIIDGAGATKEQIYAKIQWLLRQEANINEGSGSVDSYGHIGGKTADELLAFVGDTLVTSTGVFVDNIADADINFYQFLDTTSISRNYPFVAAGTITFNDNLQNDASGNFWMFYTDIPSGSFGSGSAIIVEDNTDLPITGSTYLTASRTFTFDYDGNIQGGRTAADDADVTIVAIGLITAQYVSTIGTIARTNANAFSLVAALERNYSNPV